MTRNVSSKPLVVLTRADASAIKPLSAGRTSLDARLQRAGVDVLHAPMFVLEPVDPERLVRAFDAGAPCATIIVTSPRAAAVALEVLEPERMKAALCVVPGPGTAQPLLDQGLNVVHPLEGGTSEHVLALPELAEARIRGERILILAAPGGRTRIARTLRDRGARVEVLAPYLRCPLDPPETLQKALAADRRLVTLVSSPAALERLHDELATDLRQRWLAGGLVVSSERLAERARALGATDVVRAAGASDAALLESLSAAFDLPPGQSP